MVNILASLNTSDEIHLLIGFSNGTYNRVKSIIASNAKPILITHSSSLIPSNLQKLSESKDLLILDRKFDIESDLFTLGRESVDKIVDKVFVNLPQQHFLSLKKQIYSICLRHRIPLNITSSPEFSTFTILSTHIDGDFQLGITTNGKGCMLANRIKREIVTKLPRNISSICAKIGDLRVKIQEEDQLQLESIYDENLNNLDEDSIQSAEFNKFVDEFEQSALEQKLQRKRWLNQIVEYYPLEKLADLQMKDLINLKGNIVKNSSLDSSEFINETSISKEETKDNFTQLNSSNNQLKETNQPIISITINNKNNNHENKKRGTISLVGSGPGSISNLTLGALQEIQTADLILLDKLVPTQIQSLIPSHVEKFIARKFPGNAEAAQDELLSLGLTALKEGKKVVRLKQGDPYIFGRGGEEVEFFQNQHGFKVNVLPGVTSALSAPLTAGIPSTQRDIADQVLIMTGTGRKGAMPCIPEFVKSRTMIFLMSLHRVETLVEALFAKGYESKIPCCVIERSSCPDQRVTRTTLRDLVECVQEIGSRPPGLLVLGYACEALISTDENKKWIVEEGYDVSGDVINVAELLKGIS